MADLSQYTDEDLEAIANGSTAPDYSGYSDSELMKIAGINDRTDPLATVAGSAADMMTFGLADPFNAAGLAAIDKLRGSDKSYGELYDQRLAEEKAIDAAQFQDSPISSAAGTALGFTGSLLPATAGVKAAMTPKQKLFQAMKNNAKIGGTIGGLTGAAYAKGDAEERLKEGLYGVGIGTTTGAVLPPALGTKVGRYIALPAAGAGAGALMSGGGLLPTLGGAAAGLAALKAPAAVKEIYSRITTPAEELSENVANKKIAQALQRDKISTQEAKDKLADIGEEGAIADVGGENIYGLARGTTGRPGEGRETASKFLKERQEGQYLRAEEGVQKGLGSKNFYDEELALEAQQKAASPLYQEAYSANQDIVSPEINRILKTPAGKAALADAKTRMQNDLSLMGVPDKELAEQMKILGMKGGASKGLKLRTLDYVKKAYDAQVTKALREGDYDAYRSLRKQRSTLLRELDAADKTGKYAKARDTWGGAERTKEALDDGTRFIREDAEITSRELREMSSSEREMFRIGAAKALRDIIYNTPDGADVAKRIFASPAKREKLQAIFPNKKAYEEFEKSMRSEMRMFETKGKVLGGSPTQPRQEEATEAAKAVGLLAASKSPVTSILRYMAEKAQQGTLSDMDRKFIAQKLFSKDQKENEKTLVAIENLLSGKPREEMIGFPLGLTGQTAGAIERTRND